MRDSSPNKENKPLIGISIGDVNGIGPEVVIKALLDNRIMKLVTPVIYADGKIISYYRKLLGLQNFNFNQITELAKVYHQRVNVITLDDQDLEINPGKEDRAVGAYALNSLQRAVADLKDHKIHALATAPLNKELIQTEEFNFPGHTEYLTQQAGANDSLMFLIDNTLRVGVVTGHIPLKKVSESLSQERISSKLEIMIQSLKHDFDIKKPRVAVLGLNPHAGENGLLGDEEKNLIAPVIKKFKEDGNLIFGPFAADGFFGSPQYRGYDAVLAMYHDQGLIPFKNMAFDSGVNFTAGLSFVRTSPDHGTAFGIAGKNEASEVSMRNAIFTAMDILKCRQEYS